MKVLMIDDDQSLLTIFQQALSDAGFETVSATTAREGIEKAKSEKPNLIIIDQILPDMPGNDVLKLLKDSQDTKDIPIAMMSNYSDETVMKNAISMGATDYIYKYNVEPNDVVEKVKELTSSTSNESPANEQPQENS